MEGSMVFSAKWRKRPGFAGAKMFSSSEHRSRNRGMTPQPPAQVQYVPYPSETKEIIAATLILEAGGEQRAGMLAVCNVILNRAGRDPKKAAEVCLVPFAFAPWNDKKRSVVIDDAKKHPCWSQAMMIAEQALQGTLSDTTGGANHFYSHKSASPSWAAKMERTMRLGNHTFLKGN
jgi:N-acetylmuramoyl-L-alanine amidase